jgi:MraZ protein
VFDGFLGSFERSLDDKGRLALPKAFRNQLGESFILSKVANGHCLGVWTEDEFQSVLERLGEDVRTGRQEQRHMRLFTASAVSVSQDSQGRIIVPGSLREWAGLDRTALVNGASGRIEIWSPERWAELEDIADEATDDGSWL